MELNCRKCRIQWFWSLTKSRDLGYLSICCFNFDHSSLASPPTLWNNTILNLGVPLQSWSLQLFANHFQQWEAADAGSTAKMTELLRKLYLNQCGKTILTILILLRGHAGGFNANMVWNLFQQVSSLCWIDLIGTVNQARHETAHPLSKAEGGSPSLAHFLVCVFGNTVHG